MKLRIWTALIAVYIVWGTTYLAIRFAVETLPPFLMAATRFLIPGAILYIWRRSVGDTAPTRREWRSTTIVGLFLLLGGNGCVVWAEQRVVSGIAALIVGSTPLWMVLIDALRPDGKRPGWQTTAGVLIGFAGIALLISPTSLVGSHMNIDPFGMVALLMAAFLWSVGSLYSRTAPMPSSPLLGTGMEMLAGGSALFVLGTFTGEWSRLKLTAISPQSLAGLAYLILCGSLVGFVCYTWLLGVAPISLVSTYAYVNPLVAVFMGNLLAHEPLTPRILLAALVIVSAVVMINLAREAKTKPLASLSPSPGQVDD
jgi:drug/metabolite transporter (DMT)-like permease